ncbi:MAG: 16S rRNA (guanine(527)-N(7))-methyltransferase RsmG [Chromatiaceae bacterium]
MAAEYDSRALRERLDQGLALLDLNPDLEQRERLLGFVRLLARWNQAYNLTAVRDPWDMVPRHLLDSLAVSRYLGDGPILDAGTGPGLPGLPLAVVSPARAFFLLDSNGKKVRFVRQAVMELGLSNVTVVQARMESYRTKRKFATIVSRAVAAIPEILSGVRDLLARPARLLLMTGRHTRPVMDGLNPRPYSIEVHPLRVPYLEGQRHLIDIRFD